MKIEVVYIVCGEKAKLVIEDFSYAIILSQKEGDIPISGESIDEIKKDFSAKKEVFLKKLIEYYQIFKQKNTTSIRYLLFSSLDENIGISISLEVAETVYNFHTEVAYIPCSIEGIFLLPSLKADKKEKANCYAFLKKLDEIVINNNKFNFLWLLDVNYFPVSALKEIFNIYLSTDAYAQFNTQAEANILKGEFLGNPTAYSSLGIIRLIFPAQKWQKYLSLKLKKDILALAHLSFVEPNLNMAKLAVSAWSSFFEKTNLPEIINFITLYKRLRGEREILDGILKETENVEKMIDRFFTKLEHAINQETNNIWEETLEQYTERFLNYLKKEVEDIIDKDPYGPFNALAFITLILNTHGPYTDILKNAEQKEEVPFPATLSGYLFGIKSNKESSKTLKIIFNEVVKELKIIYSKHVISLPEIEDWDDLWNELERLTNLSDFPILLENDNEWILELKEITRVIKDTSERPYSNHLTPVTIKKILNLLGKEDKRQLKQLAEEVISVEEKLDHINNQIKKLGWRKYLPHKWGLFSDKKKVEKERIEIRNRLKEKALLTIENKKRLVPCYIAIFLYEKLREKITPLEKEIREFVDSLINELEDAEKEMENISFESNELNKQVIEKTDENILKLLKLHYKEFSSQNVLDIFEKEFFSFLEFLKMPTKISSFYSKDRRKKFFEILNQFCLNKFAWLLNLNIEKILIHLGKAEQALYTLQSSCVPFLKIKEYPEEKVRQCLYIGIKDETITKFNRFPYSDCLKGTYQFYSTKNPWEIVGLKIVHGFPLFVIEGWEHLKKCYEEEESQQVKDEALEKKQEDKNITE